jgi:hypothetical protein
MVKKEIRFGLDWNGEAEITLVNSSGITLGTINAHEFFCGNGDSGIGVEVANIEGTTRLDTLNDDGLAEVEIWKLKSAPKPKQKWKNRWVK